MTVSFGYSVKNTEKTLPSIHITKQLPYICNEH